MCAKPQGPCVPDLYAGRCIVLPALYCTQYGQPNPVPSARFDKGQQPLWLAGCNACMLTAVWTAAEFEASFGAPAPLKALELDASASDAVMKGALRVLLVSTTASSACLPATGVRHADSPRLGCWHGGTAGGP